MKQHQYSRGGKGNVEFRLRVEIHRMSFSSELRDLDWLHFQRFFLHNCFKKAITTAGHLRRTRGETVDFMRRTENQRSPSRQCDTNTGPS